MIKSNFWRLLQILLSELCLQRLGHSGHLGRCGVFQPDHFDLPRQVSCVLDYILVSFLSKTYVMADLAKGVTETVPAWDGNPRGWRRYS